MGNTVPYRPGRLERHPPSDVEDQALDKAEVALTDAEVTAASQSLDHRSCQESSRVAVRNVNQSLCWSEKSGDIRIPMTNLVTI